MAPAKSEIYFAWTLLQFPGECLLAAVNETPDGRREARTVAVLPKIGRTIRSTATTGPSPGVTSSSSASTTRLGARRPQHARPRIGPRGDISDTVEIEPRNLLLMKGLGYSHPKWAHGRDYGGEVSGSNAWDIADLDPVARGNVTYSSCVVGCARTAR